MYCLLCHEKIPRLRAWRTKSEFCSDEHAALYKKQTLERLLTDQNAARKAPPSPLPLPDRDDALDHADEMDLAPRPSAEVEAAARREVEFQRSSESSRPDASGDAGAGRNGFDDLWNLAESDQGDNEPSLGGFDRFDSNEEVGDQSADDALEALRRLAEKAQRYDERSPADSHEDLESAFNDLEKSAPSMGDGDDPLKELAEPDDDFFGRFSSDDDDSSESDDLRALMARGMPHGPDDSDGRDDSLFDGAEAESRVESDADDDSDGGPSILERLMEEPGSDWSDSAQPARTERQPESTKAETEPAPAAEERRTVEESAPEAPEPPVQAAAETDQEVVDLDEAPEPDFDLDPPDLDVADLELAEDDSLEHELDDLLLAAEDDGPDEVESVPEPAASEAEPAEEEEEVPQATTENEEEPADEQALDEAAEDDQDEVSELDLEALERSLKVVPFPTPSPEKARNGHAAERAADIERSQESLDEQRPLAQGSAALPKSAKKSRTGGARTQFKPSMVMAPLELHPFGSDSADPRVDWFREAQRAAWGERGNPEAQAFDPASPKPPHRAAAMDPVTPERSFRVRSGVSLALCQPADPPPVEAPERMVEALWGAAAVQRPRALALGEGIVTGLAPDYEMVEVVVAPTPAIAPGDAAEEKVAELAERARVAPDACEPRGLFLTNLPIEDRTLEDEEWSDEEPLDNGLSGLDLSDGEGPEDEDQLEASELQQGGRRNYR